MWIWDLVVKEWPLVSRAPLSVAGLALAASAIGWTIGRFMYGQTLEGHKAQTGSAKLQSETLQERLKLKDDQLAEMRSRLELAKPGDGDAVVSELRSRLQALEPFGIARDRIGPMLETMQRKRAAIVISQEITASEAAHLFTQLTGLFQQAGWSVFPLRGTWGGDSGPDCGITLIRHSGVADDAMQLVRDVLKAGLLDFEECQISTLASNYSVPQIALSSRDPNYAVKSR